MTERHFPLFRFPRYSRKERRRLTLAAAKRMLKETGAPRRQLHVFWKMLMLDFPRGTLNV